VQLAPGRARPDAPCRAQEGQLQGDSAAALPVLTVLSPRGGYFFGLAPVLDTDIMVKSFGALTGITAVALILTQRMKYQKRSLEYQKKDLGALPFPQCLQQQRHLRHARRLG